MKTFINKNLVWHSITALLLFMLLMAGDIASAESEIHSGTTLKINSGMTIMEYGNFTILTDGDIDNLGTLIIKGNLVNENTTDTDLGTGTFEFSGTTAQEISGPNIFTNLKIDNSAGVSLVPSLMGTFYYDSKVLGTLTLTNGLLKLGSLNLTMGPDATVAVTPAPSASNMVVADGAGELRKSFSSATSFTYPVGDEYNTPEYSPVTANFTGGTFETGNYLGVNLRNVRDPALNTLNYYLDRYWTLNSSGISDIDCDLTFNFVDEDVQGITDDLYCLKTVPALVSYNKYSSGNQLTGTVTSFSRFTGSNIIDVTPNITAEPNVMHGITNYDIILQVTELNLGNTNGLITVRIPKDERWSFTWTPGAENINGKPVNNSVWTFNGTDPNFYTFTTTSVISKGNYSKLGFIANWNAGQTQGAYTITSQIDSWSGGEIKIDNNVDAEKLDYFIN